MHFSNNRDYLSMVGMHHKETKKIVDKAIRCLGKGKKGLALELGKDPSLISRYANGSVRPKAETLIECLKIIERGNQLKLSQPVTSEDLIAQISKATHNLSPKKDGSLIHTLYSVLKLANKL